MNKRYCAAAVAVLVLTAGCAAPDDGPTQYGPTPMMDRSTARSTQPGGPVPLQAASPGSIVAPARSQATCQLGTTAARGQGDEQIRYAIVGKECAAPLGTRIDNLTGEGLLGTIAGVITGGNGAWSAVAVRLEPGVGWSPSAPGAVARSGDEVDVQGIGKRFRVSVGPNGLLNLSGFTSPGGRSGAAVLDSDNRLVAITTGNGSAAVPVSDLISAGAATPGLEGLALL